MLTVFLSTFLLAAEPCGVRIQAFAVYEDLIRGRIVEKHSVYPIGPWSDASAFDGVMISRSEGSDMKLTVDVREKLNGRILTSQTYDFVPWEKDTKALFAKDFDPHKLLAGLPSGSFTLTLKKDKATICRETHGLVTEGVSQ